MDWVQKLKGVWTQTGEFKTILYIWVFFKSIWLPSGVQNRLERTQAANIYVSSQKQQRLSSNTSSNVSFS